MQPTEATVVLKQVNDTTQCVVPQPCSEVVTVTRSLRGAAMGWMQRQGAATETYQLDTVLTYSKNKERSRLGHVSPVRVLRMAALRGKRSLKKKVSWRGTRLPEMWS